MELASWDGLLYLQSAKFYERTGRLGISCIEEGIIKKEMFQNVNKALVDKVLQKSKEQGVAMTALTTLSFSEAEQSLVRQRDVKH